MKMKGIGALRDENGGMSQIPEPASAASAPAPGPESPARRALGIGASTGIGAATVRLLRSRGWDVEEFSLNRFQRGPGRRRCRLRGRRGPADRLGRGRVHRVGPGAPRPRQYRLSHRAPARPGLQHGGRARLRP